MTLGFLQYWRDSQAQTLFKEKIRLPYVPYLQKGYPTLLPKIHTFRNGSRWRAGMRIHMVTGNRTPQREQFNIDIPELQTCISVQNAIIRNIIGGGVSIEILRSDFSTLKFLTREEQLLFAANDGFNSLEEMKIWFFPKNKSGHTPGYRVDGQIIHWTSFKY